MTCGKPQVLWALEGAVLGGQKGDSSHQEAGPIKSVSDPATAGRTSSLLVAATVVFSIAAYVIASAWLEREVGETVGREKVAKAWIGEGTPWGGVLRIELEASGNGLLGSLSIGELCLGRISRWNYWRGWIEIDVESSEDAPCRGRQLLGTVVEGRMKLHQVFKEGDEVRRITFNLRPEDELLSRWRRLLEAMETKGQ